MAYHGQGFELSTTQQHSSEHAVDTDTTNAQRTLRSQTFESDLSSVRGKSMLEAFRAEKDGPMSGHLMKSAGKFKSRVSLATELMLGHYLTTYRRPIRGNEW